MGIVIDGLLEYSIGRYRHFVARLRLVRPTTPPPLSPSLIKEGAGGWSYKALASGVQDLSCARAGGVQNLSCAALVQDKSCIPVVTQKFCTPLEKIKLTVPNQAFLSWNPLLLPLLIAFLMVHWLDARR